MYSWQQQYEMVQDLVSDSDTTNLTLIKDLLHQGQRLVEANLNIDYNIDTRTFTTVTDAISGSSNQAYRLPENFQKMVHLYVTVSSTRYSGEQVFDEGLWQAINASTTVTSDFLQLFFVRGRDRLELYPIPSSAATATLIYQTQTTPLVADDHADGTITTLANGGVAITGASTNFTSAMAGRYFRIDSDGQWYRILSYGSATTLTLASKYQGVAIAAGTEAYTIGQMPNTPPDTHILPVYYAAWKYSMFRKDTQMAREWERSWKEGLNEAQQNYANPNSSNIVDSRPELGNWRGINPNWFPRNMT